eukprot:Gb_04406 [translate_table: standard]
MSFPDTNTTTSVDLRNAMFQNIRIPADLKNLIYLIDKRLSIIEQGKLLGEGRMSSEESSMVTASSRLTSDGAKLLKGISGKALKLKGFGVIDGTKTAMASVLKGFGKLHMVAAGLSMVAYTMEEFGRISSNQSECVELLREIINTSKHLIEVDEVLPEDKKAKLDKAVRMMSGGAIMCCSLMDSARLMQFFNAPVTAERLNLFREQLHRLYEDLQLDISIENAKWLALVQSKGNPIYPEYAVGIEQQIEKVMRFLGNGQTQAVLLYRLGGIGKTTIANAVYARFINNSNDTFKHSKVHLGENPNIKELLMEIVQDLTSRKQIFRDIEEGQRALIQLLSRESPIFLYIDNVWKCGDLKELLSNNLHLSEKSRILVTARKEIVSDVITSQGIECETYSVQALAFDEAKKLFCKYVFSSEEGPSDRENDINEVVKACGGIPLVLELAGAYLRQRGNGMPENYSRLYELLNQGKPFSGHKEQNLGYRLVFAVYETLEMSAQDAFLDICCFYYQLQFLGGDKYWSVVKSLVGKEELLCLEESALVKEVESGTFVSVRAVIRAMGCHKSKHTRLTDLNSFSDLLELDDDEKLREVKGIFTKFNRLRPLDLPAEKLVAMRNSLRILSLGPPTLRVIGKCNKASFPNLRYLQVGDVPCFPFDDYYQIKHLRVLISKCKDAMASFLSLPRNSEYRDAMTRIPGRELKNLELLEMRNPRVSKKLPPGFLFSPSLLRLELDGCPLLEELPNSLGEFGALRELCLTDCYSLKELPETFGRLGSLEMLYLRGCRDLQSLPEQFGLLRSLAVVNLEDCHSLEELPGSFARSLPECIGQLSSLKLFNVENCEHVKKLPRGLCELSSLVDLTIKCREGLSELPERIGELATLEYLCIECGSAPSITVPVSFGGLSSLSCLNSLRNLRVSNCKTMEETTIETVVKLESVYCVDIRGSDKLEKRWTEKDQVEYPIMRVKTNVEETSMVAAATSFFRPNYRLIDRHQNPNFPSTLPSGTRLLFLFAFIDIFSWVSGEDQLFLETIEEVKGNAENFKIIFVATSESNPNCERSIHDCLQKLPNGALALPSTDVRTRLVVPIENPYRISLYVTTTTIDEEGRKRFSKWENISHQLNY